MVRKHPHACGDRLTNGVVALRSTESGRAPKRERRSGVLKAATALSLMVLFGIAFGTGMASENSSITPGEALRRLMEGNARYVANRAEHRQRPSDAPQHPIAVILSCSDSRVPPEIAFDEGVGDLFVVRAAGNTYDRLALQSVEYAVEHLGANLIVVMGHQQCGAVKAALASYPNPHAGPMLVNIYPAVRATEHRPGDRWSETVNENAILIAKRLAEEPMLADRIKRDQLKVAAARYDMATGVVTILSPQ